MFVKDLDSLKYSELQKLAKNAGIKANQKIDKLMKALKDHYLETDEEQANCYNDISDSTKENRSGSGATNNNLAEQSTSGDKLTQLAPDHATKNNTQALSTPVSAKKADKCTRKRRRTFELDEPTLSAQSTPILEDHSEKRSSRQRTSETNAQSVAEPTEKRVRKNTYTTDDASETSNADNSADQASTPSRTSPGTKALIEEIDANLPSAERKERLLAALEKKIKTKAPASPAQRSTAQSSQIPRFMAFLANKKAEAQKPATPGNKDWTKIHKKEFSKFDSLDIYLEKKQQRMEKLSGSAKKNINTGPTLRRGAKIAKPVSTAASRLQVPVKAFVPTVTTTKNLSFNFIKTPVHLPSKTPVHLPSKTPVHLPSKTPVHLPSKTPSHQESNDAQVSKVIQQTPRTHEPIMSGKKPAIAGSRATPFIFTGTNDSRNTTVSSSKNVFDLKASLSKPLTWKPHCGKLLPVDFNKVQAPSASTASQPDKQKVERPSRQAMASKTRPVNAKDVRRVQQLDRRNNQKYVDMMKRRGLLA
jgi:hypothetical protein